MASLELSLGALTLVGEERGVHIHVSILGAGMRGQRPLCGTVVMRVEEWESLLTLLEVHAAQDRTIGELRQALDLATGPHCPSCGNAIDPDTCHCGELVDRHDPMNDGHSAVPMGCMCGYAEPDWKQLATFRGEYIWKQRAANAKLMENSGPTVADLQAEIERLTKTTDLGIAVADARRLRAERDRMRPVYEAAKACREAPCDGLTVCIHSDRHDEECSRGKTAAALELATRAALEAESKVPANG